MLVTSGRRLLNSALCRGSYKIGSRSPFWFASMKAARSKTFKAPPLRKGARRCAIKWWMTTTPVGSHCPSSPASLIISRITAKFRSAIIRTFSLKLSPSRQASHSTCSPPLETPCPGVSSPNCRDLSHSARKPPEPGDRPMRFQRLTRLSRSASHAPTAQPGPRPTRQPKGRKSQAQSSLLQRSLDRLPGTAASKSSSQAARQREGGEGADGGNREQGGPLLGGRIHISDAFTALRE